MWLRERKTFRQGWRSLLSAIDWAIREMCKNVLLGGSNSYGKRSGRDAADLCRSGVSQSRTDPTVFRPQGLTQLAKIDPVSQQCSRLDQRLRRVCCAVPDGYVVTGLDEVCGHARSHGAKPKNRNFAHLTPRLATDSCGLLARPPGVSGFTIRRRPCRNGRRWLGNGRPRPTDRGRSFCPGRGVPLTVRARRHNPAAGACCRP
jgi:hypothetical protein